MEKNTTFNDVPSRADPHLLDMLVCPKTHVPLRYVVETQELVSDQAGLAYPVREGIPVILPDMARQLDSYNK